MIMDDELEKELADGVADGRFPVEDADEIRTFAEFLVETGPPTEPISRRWLPYALGEADGPIDDPGEAEKLIESARRKRGL
jgi:hypothetical protein